MDGEDIPPPIEHFSVSANPAFVTPFLDYLGHENTGTNSPISQNEPYHNADTDPTPRHSYCVRNLPLHLASDNVTPA